MITLHPPRIRSQHRVPTQTQKTPTAQTKTFAPPVAGWVSNMPGVAPVANSAAVIENFWVTATGIEPRGGSNLRCTVTGGVTFMCQYQASTSGEYFVADSTSIYPFDDATVDGTALTADVTGQTSGDYSALETRTSGGSFLTLVNGTDSAQIYDGTSWQAITTVSSPHAITGVATSDLCHIWAYQSRQFFIEKGTMSAWYLGVNSVSGAATELPLSGVFSLGGSLLFGATLSSDSGSGMDDRCVFVTDQGEVAVYQGDPATAADWVLNGVFSIGEPLGKHAHMTLGGDLIIGTKAGLVPMSAAMTKDPSQLSVTAYTRAIAEDWRNEMLLAGSATGWRVEKWAERNLALVAPPGTGTTKGYAFAINLETMAWSKVTGWPIGDMRVLGGNLHYGDADGNVFQCDVGGTDNDAPFSCRVCLSFDHLGDHSSHKVIHNVRETWAHSVPINPAHSVAVDYRPSFPAAPNAASSVTEGSSAWDTSPWDTTPWSSEGQQLQIYTDWSPVAAQGRAFGVQLQLTSAASYKLDCTLISVDVTFSAGASVE